KPTPARTSTVVPASSGDRSPRARPICWRPESSGWRCSPPGSPYHRQHDNSWGYVFGDSYGGPNQGDNYLGSPVMLNQATFDSSGATPISFTWAMPTYGQARQTFNYRHGANNGLGDVEVTRIPNDCIEFGGRTYIQYTSVFTWGPPAGYDGSVCSGVAYSDDYGVTWTDFGYHWPGDRTGGNESLYGMWSFAGIDADGFLYIYSKRWNGSHNNSADQGLIQLFRFTQEDFHNGAWQNQQNWAEVSSGNWQWTSNAYPTPLFPAANNFGEFSVKNINGTYCMSYFDVDNYAIYTRTSPRPEGGWSVPLPQIVGDYRYPTYWGKPQVPSLYGGYIHPGSASATSLTLIVSQWPGNNAPNPYRVLQFDGINP
ncbi:DUF4185 domain-containing protein, partial [Catenulispora sp. NF23]|uniref:DUF4185 domain-containing protein n=1 Tax=Catenulispora pinistramenti TaxID=2705254 RepID=UPI001BA9DB86